MARIYYLQVPDLNKCMGNRQGVGTYLHEHLLHCEISEMNIIEAWSSQRHCGDQGYVRYGLDSCLHHLELLEDSPASCDITAGEYRILWYQRNIRSLPQFLPNYYSESDKNQGSGVLSCFSGSKNSSANAGLLLISGLHPEDKVTIPVISG